MAKKKFALKKVLAGFVSAAVLASSLFAGNVFAVDGTAEQTAKQIVHQGTLVQTEQDATTGDYAVKLQKTVEATGKENEFNITLTVTTQEKLSEIPVSSDAAVVLVIDRSGSMAWDTAGNQGSESHPIAEDKQRITLAENAAKSFLDTFVKGAGERYAALVSFSGDAKTNIDWTDLKASGNLTNFKNKIDFEAGGGTNIEGGLQLAYNLIDAAKKTTLKDIDNINVILLTDGCPTYHVQTRKWVGGFIIGHYEPWPENRASTTTIVGEKGGGDWAKYEDYHPVETLAATMQADKITLYSIAFATGTSKFQKSEESGDWENREVYRWLNGFSTAFKADDYNDLSKKFENISKLISLGAKAWEVTDPMGTYITYTGADMDDGKGNNKYTYAEEDHTLTWNLKASEPVEKPTGTYTYTLTYPITLNNAANGFVSENSYATNGTTVLKYYMFSKVEDDKEIPSEPKTVNFDVPTVKGYLGSLTFTKTDGTNPLPGATFTLNGKTATSDANGTVSFTGIPSGASYTLTETAAPEGYVKASDKTVVVSYGTPTVDGKTLTEVENSRLLYNVSYQYVGEELPADAGRILPSDPAKYGKNDTVTVAPSPVTKDTTVYNWVFDGWYLDEGCTKKVGASVVMGTADLVLYGRWSKSNVKYPVVYEFVGTDKPSDAADILPSNENKYAVGEEVPVAGTPETTDKTAIWEFKGWYSDYFCMNKVGSTVKMPAGGLYLYGKWEKTEFEHVDPETVTYTYNDYGSKHVSIRFEAVGNGEIDNVTAGTASAPEEAYRQTVAKDSSIAPVVFFVKVDEGYQNPALYRYEGIGNGDSAVEGGLYEIANAAEALKSFGMTEAQLDTYTGNGYTHVFYYTEGNETYPDQFFKVVAGKVPDDETLNVTSVTKTITGGSGDTAEEFSFEIWATLTAPIERSVPDALESYPESDPEPDSESVLFATGTVTMEAWGEAGTKEVTFVPAENVNPYDPNCLYWDFEVVEVAGSEEGWTYDDNTYSLKASWDEELEELVFESNANFVNTYTASTPVIPDPDPETTIRIKKTWDGEAYDGSVIFVVTRVGGSREWSREVTLRAGRSSTAVEVPSGGTYEVVELVPEGYESSIEGGVTVKISEGDIKTVNVTNTKLPEEEIPEESTPLAPPTDQDPSEAEGPSAPAEEIPDEETPVTNPPKTGAAAGSALAVLVAAAALGAVVFRKRK